MLLVFWVFLRW